MRGCDVSAVGQGVIDYGALAGHIDFVIAKATEGSSFADPLFARNWVETKRVGIRRGAYHFARPDLGTAAQDEARWFLANLGPVDDGDMLALDYEVAYGGDVVGWCKAWLDFVQSSTGQKPYIYLNRSHMRLNWSPVIAAGYPLWLAIYPAGEHDRPQTPWPEVAMTQWSNAGTLPGISARVDLDTYFVEDAMTQDEFNALADVWWKDHAQGPATLDAMKKVYDPLVTHVHEEIPPAVAQPTSPPITAPSK